MKRNTVFSPCRKYRYTLWREWGSDLFAGGDHESKYLMVVGLNPSTADETQDDPTIRKCIGFAKRWGFGALCMTNLFAWRDTHPENMRLVSEPIGPENDLWLSDCAKGAGMVLAAWGTDGGHMDRASAVLKRLSPVHYLVRNSDGSPRHPLYIKSTTIPQIFVP